MSLLLKTVLSDINAPDFSEEDTEGVAFGDYELTSELGRGGMGVVYEATQRSLNRKVAVKMLPSVLLAGDDAIERFRKEAEATAAIDHPNIVPVYEVGEEDGQPFMAMKLINGEPLSLRIQQLQGKPREIAEIMTKVCDAIHAAHQIGILHRDLKPGNILVDAKTGEPHVADFGLAKRIDEEPDSQLTLTGQVLGTPGFMAPEQAAGERVSTAADVYSLGAILYQLLTGKAPFSGQNVAQVLRQIEEQPPERPSTTTKGVDRDLEAITMKCLEKNPAHRYDSAADLAQDLRRWQRREPVLARQVTRAQRVTRWIQRKPLHAALSGLAATFVLTLAIGGPMVALNQAELRSQTEVESQKRLQQLYVAEMNRASSAAAEPSGLPRIDELLSKWIPAPGEADLRGWEWYYFHSLASTSEGEVFLDSPQAVKAFAWSPNRERFALGGEGALGVFRSADRSALWKLDLRNYDCGKAQFSADGRFLAARVLSTVASVVVYDAETGEEVRRWRIEFPSSGFAWAPEGNRIAICGRADGIELYELDEAEPFATHHGQYTRGFFFEWMPDGSGVVGGSLAGIVVFLAANPGAQAETWVDDGPRLEFSTIAIAPNGQKVAFGDIEGEIRVLDTASGRIEAARRGHQSTVTGMAWSPDSRRLASVGADFQLRIWNEGFGESGVIHYGHRAPINGVSWDSTDRILTWSNDRTVREWAPESRNLARSSDGSPIRSVDWSPDGSRVVGSQLELVVLDRSNAEAPPIHYDIASDSSLDVRWMVDSRSIVFGLSDQIVAAPPQELRRGELPSDATVFHSQHRLKALTLSSSRPWVASTGWSGVVVSNYETGEVLVEDSTRGWDVRFHPTEPHVAFPDRYSAEIQIIDLETGKKSVFATSAGSTSKAIDFHPVGDRLASGADSGAIEIWEYPGGSRLKTLLGHVGAINELQFSPDGSRLASASSDTTIRIWDTRSGEQVCVLHAHTAPVLSVRWSPNGKSLASSDVGGAIRIWDSE